MEGAFRLPTRVALASGAIARLPEAVGALGAERVLLVTDPGVAAQPFADAAAASLGAGCATFSEVESNPRVATVERIAAAAREHGAELLVGLGGGSVMDAAKAAAMLATSGGDLRDYIGKERFTRAPLPLIAAPTTAGTGSEVTWVAVISDEERRTKVSIKGDGMFPRAALVDPDLLAGLPSELIASTGLDALTHAVEATTGAEANPTSDALAERSIELSFRFLARAVRDPRGDAEAREGVAAASCLAGMAFGNADVAGVHCLSETLGGLYDVPHGLANAMLLAPVLRSHGDAVATRLAELEARVAQGSPAAGGPDRFLARIERLVGEVGIPPFSSLGIPAADHAAIAAGSVENGSNASNPRPMAADDYLAVLRALD
ncbi:MAG: iron-containing alcohol dehydrogenase [Planctomycetota bacterium]